LLQILDSATVTAATTDATVTITATAAAAVGLCTSDHFLCLLYYMWDLTENSCHWLN